MIFQRRSAHGRLRDRIAGIDHQIGLECDNVLEVVRAVAKRQRHFDGRAGEPADGAQRQARDGDGFLGTEEAK